MNLLVDAFSHMVWWMLVHWNCFYSPKGSNIYNVARKIILHILPQIHNGHFHLNYLKSTSYDSFLELLVMIEHSSALWNINLLVKVWKNPFLVTSFKEIHPLHKALHVQAQCPWTWMMELELLLLCFQRRKTQEKTHISKLEFGNLLPN